MAGRNISKIIKLMGLDYKTAGVDIDADSESVNKIKEKVKSTYSDKVVVDLGSFGAMYDLAEIKDYKDPILVQSIDGVGTKVKLGPLVGRYDTFGEDIVNHSVNDIICQGAKPLTFLDYIASYKTEPAIIEEIVTGMIKACSESGVSLIGGETAEMSTVYAPDERDIAGCITGVVERDKVITGENIKAGNILLGLGANGLHTNGFTLVRKIFFKIGNYQTDHQFSELDVTLGEELTRPHKGYASSVLKIIKQFEVKGIAHITGGGLTENVPRALPSGLAVEIDKSSWPVLSIFSLIQKLGEIDESEMYRVFNMGIGMVLVVSADIVQSVSQELEQLGEKVYQIGKVIAGENKVIFK